MSRWSVRFVLASLALLGCDDRPDLAGRYVHPVNGSVSVDGEAHAFPGPWTVEVVERGDHAYTVRFEGCELRTEEQINGVAALTSGQRCEVPLPTGDRAEIEVDRGQIDYRSDLGINLSFTARGRTSDGRSVTYNPLFPGGSG